MPIRVHIPNTKYNHLVRTVVLAEFLVPPEEAVSRGLLEAERGRDAAVDLRGGVLPVQVHLLGRHPVHVELGEVDRVVHLKQTTRWRVND